MARHLQQAREKVAALINADPREIIFTSCGTESNNAAMHSALRLQPEKRHVVTTAVEHSATIKFAESLSRQGVQVTFLPVEPDGSLDLHLLEQSIRPDTAIVSIMWANNETGVLSRSKKSRHSAGAKKCRFIPMRSRRRGKCRSTSKQRGWICSHCPPTNYMRPRELDCFSSVSSMKFEPLLIGGQQERGRRGGTENVASIVGFGRAAELALANFDEENTRVRALRDRLETQIFRTIPGALRNGAQEPRLPNTSNISFDGVEAEAPPDPIGSVGNLRFQRLRMHERLSGALSCAARYGSERTPRAGFNPV